MVGTDPAYQQGGVVLSGESGGLFRGGSTGWLEVGAVRICVCGLVPGDSTGVFCEKAPGCECGKGRIRSFCCSGTL